jgi:hypothetical protein
MAFFSSFDKKSDGRNFLTQTYTLTRQNSSDIHFLNWKLLKMCIDLKWYHCQEFGKKKGQKQLNVSNALRKIKFSSLFWQSQKCIGRMSKRYTHFYTSVFWSVESLRLQALIFPAENMLILLNSLVFCVCIIVYAVNWAARRMGLVSANLSMIFSFVLKFLKTLEWWN